MLTKAYVRASVATAVVLSTLVGLVGVASATTYDPTSDATNFANTATSTAAPIIFIVAGALIALAVVFWVVKYVFGMLRRAR